MCILFLRAQFKNSTLNEVLSLWMHLLKVSQQVEGKKEHRSALQFSKAHRLKKFSKIDILLSLFSSLVLKYYFLILH